MICVSLLLVRALYYFTSFSRTHLIALFFFFNDTATTEIYTLSLHDALPICLSRDKLTAYLWPESDTEHGRGLLKQACYALRRDLGTPELFLGSIELRLNPGLISSDVESFEGALDQHDPARAVSLYRGPFLDGFYLNGEGDFGRWVEGDRACRVVLVQRAFE